MEEWLTRRWYEKAAGFSLLRPLAWIYGLVTRTRRRAYERRWLRTYRSSAPVLVVGNLTVGGTGKTPLVAWLAERLGARGLRVGIVSRGYGRAGSAPRAVDAQADWREVGDEPVLLQARTGCDIVVARDRSAGVRELAARGAQVIIADDGLQHLRLARDCEVVVIDGARGFGNGLLLPAGPLREPATRVRDADMLVINGPPEHSSLRDSVFVVNAVQMSLQAAQAHRVDGTSPPVPLATFRGQRVHAVAGIGNPARFFRSLRERGLDPIEHAYPDHHAFRAGELEFPDRLPVLMTEKDAVRCRGSAGPRSWYVPVTAAFSEAHSRRLLELVARKLGLESNAGG
ncbi:MAG TPA: tetraacyldisaccharide 4'-kinase [Steroidobacteraceae bacterium]|nr:tetraacyldisaccharide 4'-kinase [Steroidobacteraceae bacterium]